MKEKKEVAFNIFSTNEPEFKKLLTCDILGDLTVKLRNIRTYCTHTGTDKDPYMSGNKKYIYIIRTCKAWWIIFKVKRLPGLRSGTQ